MFASDSSPFSSKLHLTQEPGKKRVAPCQVDHCSGKWLQITTLEPVPVGAAISVEHEDALLLGEVFLSKTQAHCYQIEIKVEQTLNGLMNLMALRSRLLQEADATVPQPVFSQIMK